VFVLSIYQEINISEVVFLLKGHSHRFIFLKKKKKKKKTLLFID